MESVKNNILLSKNDWDSYETSWDFQKHPLIPTNVDFKDNAALSLKIGDYFDNWKKECQQRFNKLKANEEELNRIFIEIYGLQDELKPDVQDKDVTVRLSNRKDDIKSFISYAVGCMFGRYSLNIPGLAYAGGNMDMSKYKYFIPDVDNVIPITDEEYFKDDIVYYSVTGLFYKCKVANTTNLPTVTSDWQLYNDSVINYTQDSDILEAFEEAKVNFNEGLFPDDATRLKIFLFLVAHYLTVDFNIALGVNQIGILTSKSVGSVSEGYSIPAWLLNNPALSMYASTGYGIKYCSLIKPYITGNFFIVKGRTT